MVYLPLLGMLWWVYARREQALMDLAQGVQRPFCLTCNLGCPGAPACLRERWVDRIMGGLCGLQSRSCCST